VPTLPGKPGPRPASELSLGAQLAGLRTDAFGEKGEDLRIVEPDVVFLDVGATLIYAEPSVGEVYADVLRAAGVDVTPEAVQRCLEETIYAQGPPASGRKAPYGDSASESRLYWRGVVGRCFQVFGLGDTLDAVTERLWDYFASPEAWRVYPDVRPALESLRANGQRLALITNWDSRLVRILTGLGLWAYFECKAISFEVGYEKPDSRIFDYALRRCGTDAEKTIHVGDRYQEDVIGALSAGITPVWLQRRPARSKPPGAIGVIHTLAQLPGLCGRA